MSSGQSSPVVHGVSHRATAIAIAFLAAVIVSPASAWIHDANDNGIDDRIERVAAQGRALAYEDADPTRRPIIALSDVDPLAPEVIEFGIYIGYDDPPGPADLARLTAVGLSSLKPYRYIDYVRSQASFDQIEAIVELPGVVRVEAIPMMYTMNHWGSRVVRARDSRGLARSENYALFPSAREELGLDGTGVVVAVLDTGVNDETDLVNPGYPGHEALRGKFLGGGEFYFGNPLFNTGLDESTNPQDHGSVGSSYHATHVAGTAIGTGGQDGTFAGVAPAARLVDCKVLSDAGVGFGSADGVEWCIHNKDNDWGLAGADTVYAGIDVLNLSLGGLDSSDGTDAGSQMINAAVNAGLVVCIATGNDGELNWIASPAAADLCIAVGATGHDLSLDREDDEVTDFSNEGPRLDDGDGDHHDEMKPSVCAPGAGIFSADGDFATQGESYHTLSGTSMATPHVAGVAALLRQANPTLTPLEIRSILQDTAEHNIVSVKGDRPNDPFGLDPNYDPGCGWGLVDAYAAGKEALASATGVQVTQIRLRARPDDGEIDVAWITQREHPFQGFDVWRAPDDNGAPGTFVKRNSVLIAPGGDPVLAGDDNRTLYTFVDDDPALEIGETYWYQVAWIDATDAPHLEPAAPVTFGTPAVVATVVYAIRHNTPDNDLLVTIGESSGFFDPHQASFSVFGLGEAEQDSFIIHEPANAATATTGYLEHFWSVRFTEEDGIEDLLPPGYEGGPLNEWFVNVLEGGYLNRSGALTAFSMFVNDSPGSETGTLYVTGTTTPQVTIETQEATLWIPDPGTIGVADESGATPATRVSPLVNPIAGPVAIRYDLAEDGITPVVLSVHDVTGRRVREFVLGPQPAGRAHHVVWDARDDRGRSVSPGVYFVRLSAGGASASSKVTLVE